MKSKLKIFALILLISINIFIFITNYWSVFTEKGSNTELADNSNKEITLSFVGDILLDSNVEDMINSTSADYPFENIKGVLSSNDFVIGNLENPVSSKGKILLHKSFNFRANPNVIEGIKNSNINVVSIANNHIMDYGSEAMLETVDLLKSNNIYFAGAGSNEEEASKISIIEKDGKRIAFIAASRVLEDSCLYAKPNRPGVFQAYNSVKLLDTIKKADSFADVVIVYLHWGEERAIYPEHYQKNLAVSMIDCGADIVVGSHPHVLQGFQYYKDKLIAYSMGNFVFTNTYKDTMILKIKINEDNTYSSEIIPCMIKNYRPEPITDPDKLDSFYKSMQERSYDIEIQDGKIVENGDI